jgi:hypothetical protein
METMRAPYTFRDFFAPELRAWCGEMALARVYWGYGVGVSLALGLAMLGALSAGARLLEQTLLLTLAVYTVWILVAVWRCAAQSARHWCFLARLSTLAWACNAALILGFLQLDLVASAFAQAR